MTRAQLEHAIRKENLIRPDTVVARVESLPCVPEERKRLTEWIEMTVDGLKP